jgi:hypothetical protein
MFNDGSWILGEAARTADKMKSQGSGCSFCPLTIASEPALTFANPKSLGPLSSWTSWLQEQCVLVALMSSLLHGLQVWGGKKDGQVEHVHTWSSAFVVTAEIPARPLEIVVLWSRPWEIQWPPELLLAEVTAPGQLCLLSRGPVVRVGRWRAWTRKRLPLHTHIWDLTNATNSPGFMINKHPPTEPYHCQHGHRPWPVLQDFPPRYQQRTQTSMRGSQASVPNCPPHFFSEYTVTFNKNLFLYDAILCLLVLLFPSWRKFFWF